jgi:hypothetical protein
MVEHEHNCPEPPKVEDIEPENTAGINLGITSSFMISTHGHSLNLMKSGKESGLRSEAKLCLGSNASQRTGTRFGRSWREHTSN